MNECQNQHNTQLAIILSGYVDWYRSRFPDDPSTQDGAIVRVLNYVPNALSYTVKAEIFHVLVPEQYVRLITYGRI